MEAGRLDKSILPMLEYELGSEFGTSTPNASFRGVCKCFYEWQHGEVNYQLKHTTHYRQLHRLFGRPQQNLKVQMDSPVVKVE